jgi:hypothetical protein
LMMEGLTKPIRVAARSLSPRRKRNKQRRKDDQSPETLPHNQPPNQRYRANSQTNPDNPTAYKSPNQICKYH